MSKKIDGALKDLLKALRAHSRVASSGAKSVKKAQRASARVSTAASAYAEAVHAKSGMENPFAEVLSSRLPDVSLKSLAAERDHLADKRQAKGKKTALKAS